MGDSVGGVDRDGGTFVGVAEKSPDTVGGKSEGVPLGDIEVVVVPEGVGELEGEMEGLPEPLLCDVEEALDVPDIE